MEERLFPEENEWDKWVEEHPWGRYTYLSGYGKVIKKVFNFPYFYLFHKEGDKIQSGFPVFLLRNLCGKRYLLSIPFSEYGGPLGESKVFISEIEQILKDTKAHFLEIHGGTGMKEDSSYLTFPMHHYALLHIKQKTPQDILDNDLSFLDEIGLKEHLSPTRSNGLSSMIKQVKLYALVFKTKSEQQ